MGGAYSTTRTEKGQGSVYRPSRPRHIARATVVTETPGSIAEPPIRNDLPLSGLPACKDDPDDQDGSANCEPAAADGAS